MTQHLYELTNEYNSLIALLEDSEIDEQTLKNKLLETKGEMEFKFESLGKIILELDAKFEIISKEIDRLTNRSKTFKNRKEWLKSYVLQEMQIIGKDKIEGDILTLSLAKNPMSIEIVDENLVPDEFKEQVITYKIDKKKIADRVKDTGEIPNGINVITDKKSLRIR